MVGIIINIAIAIGVLLFPMAIIYLTNHLANRDSKVKIEESNPQPEPESEPEPEVVEDIIADNYGGYSKVFGRVVDSRADFPTIPAGAVWCFFESYPVRKGRDHIDSRPVLAVRWNDMFYIAVLNYKEGIGGLTRAANIAAKKVNADYAWHLQKKMVTDYLTGSMPVIGERRGWVDDK